MEIKTSKAQLEVWEWKNNLYQEIKDIPRDQQLKYIRKKVEKTVAEIRESRGEVTSPLPPG